MVSAFILVNAEVKTDLHYFLNQIKKDFGDRLVEGHVIYGRYDMILRMKSSKMNEEIGKLRHYNEIKEIQTLMIINNSMEEKN